MINKHRLSLNADSQSCLRFACFPQEHQSQISDMSPDKQKKREEEEEEVEEEEAEQRRP